jgi:2-polyprenyl-3-methyl-5-hydroxy-6-metoxy-1,4-benzoquinol methylase
VKVLRTSAELRDARERAHALGLCSVPDESKAWDNLFAVDAVREAGVGQEEPIADLGCRSGILLTWLDQLGYRCLYGCDLRLPLPPLRSALATANMGTALRGARAYLRHRSRLAVAPVEDTGFPGRAFAVVTAMSVIEHGVDTGRFLAEAARLLRPGGALIVSTDYWPHGIDTRGLKRFAQTQRGDRVFSTDDIQNFLREAEAYDLRLLGEPDLAAEIPLIESDGLRYTFIVFQLTRSAAF